MSVGNVTGIAFALGSAVPQLDGFYPLVSLAAFLSGGCFGFYAAWRGYHYPRLAKRLERERDRGDSGRLAA